LTKDKGQFTIYKWVQLSSYPPILWGLS